MKSHKTDRTYLGIFNKTGYFTGFYIENKRKLCYTLIRVFVLSEEKRNNSWKRKK